MSPTRTAGQCLLALHFTNRVINLHRLRGLRCVAIRPFWYSHLGEMALSEQFAPGEVTCTHHWRSIAASFGDGRHVPSEKSDIDVLCFMLGTFAISGTSPCLRSCSPLLPCGSVPQADIPVTSIISPSLVSKTFVPPLLIRRFLPRDLEQSSIQLCEMTEDLSWLECAGYGGGERPGGAGEVSLWTTSDFWQSENTSGTEDRITVRERGFGALHSVWTALGACPMSVGALPDHGKELYLHVVRP
jgi:hypothetical protein